VSSQWGRVTFGSWGSETPEPIHLKFDMFDYVHSPTPHAKYGEQVQGVKMESRDLDL